MTRVSLKEAYDNKDVVAQIYAIRDIAEGASDTADSAKTTADDAKTYVDTLGVQVEGAVQTANNASASAQESAETVSQYDARLTEVEGDLNQAESDIDGLETGLGAVTARIQTAEGNIVTIQGRVTALETADGQNVKLTGPNAIGNYAVLLTGNQGPITGVKTFQKIISNEIELPYRFRRGKSWLYSNDKRYLRAFRYTSNSGVILRLNVIWGFNTPARWGMADVIISGSGICKAEYHGTNVFGPGNIYVCAGTDGYTYLVISNGSGYNGVTVEITNSTRYGQNDDIPGFEVLTESATDTEPTVGDVYTAVYQGSAI